MNYAAYIVTELKSKEIEGAGESIEQIMSYVNENLLKVLFLNIDFSNNVTTQFCIGFYYKEYFFTFQINVYFSTMNMETVEESPTYTFSSFFSNLGGSLSLYIGISFISALEMAEFAVKIGLTLIGLS